MDGASPISWNFPELPGDGICLFPTLCVPWEGGGEAAHTEEGKNKRKEKKKVNNLRDKAPATEPNLLQAPAAAFGHLD